MNSLKNASRKIASSILIHSLFIGLFAGGVVPFFLAAEERIHRVESRETLYSLSLQYGVSIGYLKEANHLDRDTIRVGETLIIPPRYADKYTVQPGDTLSQIALSTGINLSRLASLNRINPEDLRSGMELELVRPPEEGETRIIREGDTLSWISLKYDISVARLKQINNLNSNALQTGQKLRLTASRPQTITVQPGESLWKISSRYNITMADLQKWNSLNDETLLSGQTLQLYAVLLEEPEEKSTPVLPSIPPKESLPEPQLQLAGLNFAPPIYYSRPTDKKTQPDRRYSEEDLDSPYENYKKASALIQDFDHAIESLPPLGNSLAGYKIVLDPGHGGLDPGAIVENQDGQGNKVYVVEDEYCYDIALRVYKDLKRNGADVFLTVISPNQTIRQSLDASLTFVNEKNEVWNEEAVNKRNLSESWPVGNSRGLNKRVALAKDFFGNSPSEKTLFVSIHADNQPHAREGTIVLYHQNAEGTESQKMADVLKNYLGMGSYAHSQQLRVLNQNPAAAAVLIEIRNLAYPNNSWAIRNEKLRQDDADRIVNGLIGFANSRTTLR